MIRNWVQRWMSACVPVGVMVASTALALAASGGFDLGFGVGGIVREPARGGLAHAWATAVQADGRILAAGSDQNDFRIRRYLADGTDDASFGTGGIVSLFDTGGTGTAHPTVFDLAVDGYGRILGVGVGAVTAPTVGFVPRATVVRLLADGSPDTAFGTGGVVHFSDAKAAAAATGAKKATVASLVGVAVQVDGKIVVTGRVYLEGVKKSAFTSECAIFLARLHPSGVLDTSFGIGGLVVHDRTTDNDSVGIDSVGIQSDGRIVVGSSTSGSGSGQSDLSAGRLWVITRYLPTGAVDAAFGAVLGANRRLLGLTVDVGGRILVSGSQSSVLDANDVAVARYLPDGVPDTTFGAGGVWVFGPNANDQAGSSPVVMGNGRIALAVRLSPSSLAEPRVVRLTAAGALDTSFGSGGLSDALQVGNTDNVGRAVAVAPNGDVILSGRAVFSTGTPPSTTEWIIARYLGN